MPSPSNQNRRSYLRASLLGLLGLGAALGWGETLLSQTPAPEPRFGLVIHGGANSRKPGDLTPEREQAYRDALREALSKGYAILERGGPSLDAVEAAIRVMEDSPLFNAGKGAAFTHEGTNELDASIMDGRTWGAGAITGVKHVKNPISLARLVMEKSPHVLMAGDGAFAFALEQGVEYVSQDYFYTDQRWNQLMRRQELGAVYGTSIPDEYREATPPRDPDDGEYSTVGAAALDQAGHLAAGTSTGGRVDKRHGRIGDSPVIGAGTYANDATCAASTTGLGENHLRLLTTKEISTLMEYEGLAVQEATDLALETKLREIDAEATGGVIAIDGAGNIAMSFTTEGMSRGYVREDGEMVVALFRDE